MKKVRLFLQSVSIAVACISTMGQPNQPDDLRQSTQLLVVTVPDWNAVEGRLQRYERPTVQQSWHTVGEPIQIVVGKKGMGWGIGVDLQKTGAIRAASDPVKKEGDGKSPAGIFRLGTSFGYAPHSLTGARLPYLFLTPSIECVDDPQSKHYGQIVDRSATAIDWKSSEHMRDSGEAYRWGIVVEHNLRSNQAVVSAGGSCVFLHIWHDVSHGTAGCTAMPQSDVEALLLWLDPAKHPLLVQLPQSKFDAFQRVYPHFVAK